MRRFALTALLASLVAATSSCSAQNAVAGGLIAAQALFVGEAQEIELGKQTRDEVLKEYPAYPNPTLRDYLQEIGMKLVAQQERKNLAWEWYVVDSAEPNAFAAPGGFVFVTTAALKLMKNEAQLAGVVGHEVGHVAKQHSLNAIRTTMVAQGIITGAVGQTPGELTKAGASIAANLILKHGDRNQELEADKLGATYAYGLGYDPRALGTFLGDLEKLSASPSGWLSVFSDHPATQDRLDKLNAYFTEQKWSFDGKTLGEDTYQTKVLATLGAATPATTP